MRAYPFAFAASLLASPAVAGPQEDAACITAKLSAGDVETIVNESLAGGSSEALSRVTPLLDVCGESGGWTARRRADAAAYAIGMLDRTLIGRRLAAATVDTGALDRWFARQSLEFRTTAFMGMGEAETNAVLGTLTDNEVPAATLEREGRIIGGYIAALVIIERIERGLEL